VQPTRFLIEALGRQARWALPIGVLIGIALPSLASWLRPALTATVIATMAITLTRLNWSSLSKVARDPRLPLAMSLWLLIVTPLLAYLATRLFGLSTGLSVALFLQCASAPVGSAAAFALFIGINGERVMILTVLTTVLLPLTLTPLVVWVLSESGVKIDFGSFFLRVCLLVAAPFAIAAVVRRVVGVATLVNNQPVMAGINVIALVVFAIAIMDGVNAYLFENPTGAFTLLFASFIAAIALHASAFAAFRVLGNEAGWVASVASGSRNMGLMLAITAGSAGPVSELYFGIAQIPMYCVPLLLGPIVAWVNRSATPSPKG
jgi:BASS family bile acid:Na+ symporter